MPALPPPFIHTLYILKRGWLKKSSSSLGNDRFENIVFPLSAIQYNTNYPPPPPIVSKTGMVENSLVTPKRLWSWENSMILFQDRWQGWARHLPPPYVSWAGMVDKSFLIARRGACGWDTEKHPPLLVFWGRIPVSSKYNKISILLSVFLKIYERRHDTLGMVFFASCFVPSCFF